MYQMMFQKITLIHFLKDIYVKNKLNTDFFFSKLLCEKHLLFNEAVKYLETLKNYHFFISYKNKIYRNIKHFCKVIFHLGTRFRKNVKSGS